MDVNKGTRMARIGSGLWKKVGSKSGVKNGSGERSGAVYLLDSSSQILKCVKAKPVVRQGRKVSGLVFFQGFQDGWAITLCI